MLGRKLNHRAASIILDDVMNVPSDTIYLLNEGLFCKTVAILKLSHYSREAVFIQVQNLTTVTLTSSPAIGTWR
jgi:hypothetical protein